MANVAKYLLTLEGLKFPKKEDKQSEEDADQQLERIEKNLTNIRRFTKVDPFEILKRVTCTLRLPQLDEPLRLKEGDNIDVYACYGIFLEYVLLEIAKNTDFNSDAREDLVSVHHTALCVQSLHDLSVVVLRENLHPLFYGSGVFTKVRSGSHSPDYGLLYLSVEFFDRMLKIRQFHVTNAIEPVLCNYMSAIMSLNLAHKQKEWSLPEGGLLELEMKLNVIWDEMSKADFIRNLLLLKGMPKLPMEMQKQLHQQLIHKLMAKDGFASLVVTLRSAQKSEEQRGPEYSEKRINQIVANIVSMPGHTKRFQQLLIKQIFEFCKTCLMNESMMSNMGAALLSLRRLSDLNEESRAYISATLSGLLSPLIEPTDVLTGLILMEYKDYCLLISLFFHLFCTSSVECLTTEHLINFLPLLLQLYYKTPGAFIQKRQIGDLIIRCLHNRTTTQLKEIVQNLYSLNYDPCWKQLHPRIAIFPDADNKELVLKVTNAEQKQEFSISLTLPELLMTSKFHDLTYRVFMVLLDLMANTVLDGSEMENGGNIDLVASEEELITFLNASYPTKVEIIFSLNTLVSYEPLKMQISDHALEFLEFLRGLIKKRISVSCKDQQSGDQILLIMLTLTYEMLEFTDLPETFRDFVPVLQTYQGQCTNHLIVQRIDSLISLLNGEMKGNVNLNATAFNAARSLIESKESHLQVYGIQMLLDLLRKADVYTMSNGHVIIALALAILKEKESYTFLNCVRLFVALVQVMEAEVLEVLSGEYLNDSATMDYRLVVGEAILKVSKEMGPLTYKYKDTLVNCFMYGARSPLDEFRMSSYANLAQLCNLLSYQVHKFFQELLNLIDCELSTGEYLPAKRAATLVLSELLGGIDNLFDFEEMLLPIYRVLKFIEGDESGDEKMRIHAANGLKALTERCKKFLMPEQELVKEIKVLDINNESKGSNLKKHILEMS